MSLTEDGFDLIFQSDPESRNTINNGSEFTVDFDSPLEIPRLAKNVSVGVPQATVWFTTPNIVEGQNRIYLTGSVSDILTIPAGLYSVDLLQEKIKQLLQDDADKMDFGSNDATNRVTFTFNEAGFKLEFKEDSPQILGFSIGEYEPQPNENGEFNYPNTIEAPNKATFNTLDYFLIHCDIVENGIQFNDFFNSIVAKVPINTSPGRQVNYQPVHILRSKAQSLAEQPKTKLRFWLTDQNNKAIDTFGESWSVVINVKYYLPHLITTR